MAGAINSHDVIALTTLMAADHVFVDSLGNRVRGARSMEAGWRGYFAMCPDYWIRTDDVMAADDTVSAAGEAGGTIDGESWRVPAAWKAVVRDGSGGNGRYLRTTNRFTRFWADGSNSVDFAPFLRDCGVREGKPMVRTTPRPICQRGKARQRLAGGTKAENGRLHKKRDTSSGRVGSPSRQHPSKTLPSEPRIDLGAILRPRTCFGPNALKRLSERP